MSTPSTTFIERQIAGIKADIKQRYAWMHQESYDERAVAWHRHKISELRSQLADLEKGNDP